MTTASAPNPEPVVNRLDAAQRALRAERRRCVDEREAFRAFHTNLANQQVSTPAGTTPPLLNARQQTDDSLERIQRSYERTIMSVPHYDDEYGDTFETSLQAEFGPDVAIAFRSSKTVSETLRRTMVSAAMASYTERVEFIEVVDTEAKSLDHIRNEVAAVHRLLTKLDEKPLSERGFDELRSLYDSVVGLQDQLDSLVGTRLSTIATHRHTLSSLHADVTEFFYAELDVRYPALATLADLGEIVETAIRRIERHLAATP